MCKEIAGVVHDVQAMNILPCTRTPHNEEDTDQYECDSYDIDRTGTHECKSEHNDRDGADDQRCDQGSTRFDIRKQEVFI